MAVWADADSRRQTLEISGGARQLGCESRDRLGVDLALVPFLDHGEIRISGLPALAALPAMAGEIIRGRRQYIRRAAQEVAAAVAVEINGVFDIVRWHELGLADLAGPGAVHFSGRKIAAIDDAQRIQQFGPKHVGPAAIVSQRRQRAA